MTGRIGAHAAYTPIFTPQPQPGAAAPAARDPRPGMSGSAADRENQRLLGLLTPEDWDVVSASVGYRCGPDETGYVHPVQPALAVSLAFDRDFGRLQGPLTSGYLKGDAVAGQAADLLLQLRSAIDFLETRPGRRATDSDDPPRRRIDVLA